LGASASASATVTVSVPISSFQIGALVQTTASFNVRNKPNLSAKTLCTQPAGSSGTITQGPNTGGGYTWWYVSYNTRCSGWTVQNYLMLVTS
jgi:hypothetical protein